MTKDFSSKLEISPSKFP